MQEGRLGSAPPSLAQLLEGEERRLGVGRKPRVRFPPFESKIRSWGRLGVGPGKALLQSRKGSQRSGWLFQGGAHLPVTGSTAILVEIPSKEEGCIIFGGWNCRKQD